MNLSKRAILTGRLIRRGQLQPWGDSMTCELGVDWADRVALRADSETDPENWVFRGEASVVGHDYTVRDQFGEFTERIAPGAFDKTLSESPDVMLNFMHDPMQPLVTTRSGLKLSADPNLVVDALIPRSDVDAQRIMPKVQRGDASSMSFAFRVMRQEWNEDYTDRTITEVDLKRGDVAVIVSGHGANPAAWGTVRIATDSSHLSPEMNELVDRIDGKGWATQAEIMRADFEFPDPYIASPLDDPEFIERQRRLQLAAARFNITR